MVSQESVDLQLKRIQFNSGIWGRAEIKELPNILIPDEQIYECVNGFYEGGFAMLVGTNVRVVLIDKKPLNFLTVEDLRFDMINEIDYSHRLMGAQITISTGSKTMRFRSYNQQRLRKLITHVQHCMAESKQRQSQHAEGQNLHLEQINQQLQTYLIAQYYNQQELTRRLEQAQQQGVQIQTQPEIVQPSPELADYLFAQGLLRQHELQTGQVLKTEPTSVTPLPTSPANQPASPQLTELYADGMQEVFGHRQGIQTTAPTTPVGIATADHHSLEINPLRIAYSKLPMALRNRKFGRPTPRAIPSQPVTLSQPAQ